MARSLDPIRETPEGIWTSGQRKSWTIALFFGLLLTFMARTVGPVTMVAMAKEFHWGKEVQGSILSSWFWGSGMSQLLGGWMADVYGGENVLFWTCTFWITIVFCTPPMVRLASSVYLSSSTMYLLLRFLLGVFLGAFPGAMASLLGKKLETSHKSSTNGIINSGACLGSVLIGVAGSLLLDNVDWSSVFFCIGVFGIMWLLIVKFTLLGKTSSDKLSGGEELSYQKKFLSVPWMILLSHCPLWAMVFANISISICFNGLSTWLPIYFHESFPQSKGWIFNVIPWLINSPCAFISGIWAECLMRKDYSLTCVRKFFNALALLGAAFSLILLSYAESFAHALLLMTFAIGMTGFHNGGAMVSPQDLAPDYAGSVAGMGDTISSFTVFGTVYFTGYFLAVFQSWPLYFNVVAGVCICGCLVFSIFGSAKKISLQ